MSQESAAETSLATLYVAEELHEKVKAISWITKTPMHTLATRYAGPSVERDFAKLFPNGLPKPSFKRNGKAAK